MANKTIVKAKNSKWIQKFYTRKYLIRHIISEGGLTLDQIKNESTKMLRDMLYKIRNAVVVTPQ